MTLYYHYQGCVIRPEKKAAGRVLNLDQRLENKIKPNTAMRELIV